MSDEAFWSSGLIGSKESLAATGEEIKNKVEGGQLVSWRHASNWPITILRKIIVDYCNVSVGDHRGSNAFWYCRIPSTRTKGAYLDWDLTRKDYTSYIERICKGLTFAEAGIGPSVQ